MKKNIIIALLLTFLMTSCGLVRDDLDPCPTPKIVLRFVYDYNMNRANAFHNQVDCLSVYFFDEEGKLLYIENVTDSEQLADENYRMYPDLEPGNYKVIAYGGMDCENASFYRTGNFTTGTHYTNLHVQLDPTCLSDPEKYRLHNHFYGALDFTVNESEDTYATVEMMRNTNSIQVALQNENTTEPIDVNDFIFEITDDNNDFSYDNSLMQTGMITYNPWKTTNRSTADTEEPEEDNIPTKAEGADEFHAAIAQFTTSRLVLANSETKPTSTRLNIHKADGTGTVFSIPLVNYMLMFKHDNSGAGLDNMGDQEYLDRENTWNFVFFIRDGMWVQNHIIVNDWEVRMNTEEF